MVTTSDLYNKLTGWAQLAEWTVDPFQTSELTKLQDFYWLRYEDLFNKAKMKELWVKDDEIKFIEENRETMYAIKSTEWIEMREWLENEWEWIRIRDFYGITLDNIKKVEDLIKLWVKREEIQFIKWDDFDLTPYYKKDEWTKWWTTAWKAKGNWPKTTKATVSVSDTKEWTWTTKK